RAASAAKLPARVCLSTSRRGDLRARDTRITHAGALAARAELSRAARRDQRAPWGRHGFVTRTPGSRDRGAARPARGARSLTPMLLWTLAIAFGITQLVALLVGAG